MTRLELKTIPTTSLIYKITNPKGRIYVGQTINAKNRFRSYLRAEWLNNEKVKSKIARSFRKYGADLHSFEIIEEIDISDLEIREEFWIDKLDTMKNGLNTINRNYTIFEFKSNRNVIWTDERRENQSKSIKQRHEEGCYKDRNYTKLSKVRKGIIPAWDKQEEKFVIVRKEEFYANERFVGTTSKEVPGVKQKKKKPIKDLKTGIIYEGVKDCMAALGKSTSFIYACLKTGEFEYYKI
tara:strand:- start:70 stop:786 length:717 start_codon:yes stop_codon:yes gene_type:complete